MSTRRREQNGVKRKTSGDEEEREERQRTRYWKCRGRGGMGRETETREMDKREVGKRGREIERERRGTRWRICLAGGVRR